MRVAFLMSTLVHYDAISNYSYDIMKEVSRNHDVSLYVFKTNRNISDFHIDFLTRQQEHNLLEATKVTINPYRLVRKLSKYHVIVAIIPHASDALILPLLSRCINRRLKLVVDNHGVCPLTNIPHRHESLQRRLIGIYHFACAKYLIKRSDFLIVHSNYMKKEALSCLGAKGHVLPIGIDTKRFNNSVDGSTIRKKFRLKNSFVLLYVGALRLHKRVNLLLEALFQLKKENIKLLIVGDGPEREQLEEYVSTHNLRDKVFFAGYVHDVDIPKYYSACDAFVTASLHEGVCIPILEAFACGKPAIVPNNTAMPETLNDGGLIYQEESLSSLIEKVELIRENEGIRQKLGKIGLRIAAQRDNMRCAEEYRMFLERILVSPEKSTENYSLSIRRQK